MSLFLVKDYKKNKTTHMLFFVLQKLVLKGFMEMHAAMYVEAVLTTRAVITSTGAV